MNRKSLMVATGVVLGSVMLIATAFASITGNTGYSALKSAMRNTATAKSITANIEVGIIDNGNVLGNIKSALKADRENENVSQKITFQNGTTVKNFEMYRQDGKMIVKGADSNIYNVIDEESARKHFFEKMHERQNDSEAMKDREKFIDALVGDLQNYFVLNNLSGGESEVSIQLNANQIHPAVNAFLSMAFKGNAREHKWGMHGNFGPGAEFSENFPKLVDDVSVKSMDLKVSVNKDNMIKSNIINVSVSGKDAEGKIHELGVKIKIDLSNFNSTTPESVDLKGKQVKNIKQDELRENHMDID